jgi:hypothetical protein
MSAPLVIILSETNPVQVLPSFFFKVNFCIKLPSKRRSSKGLTAFHLSSKILHALLFLPHDRHTFNIHLKAIIKEGNNILRLLPSLIMAFKYMLKVWLSWGRNINTYYYREDNIKLARREVGWGGGVDWIDMAQNRDRWRAVVNAVMNFRVS